MRKKLALLLGLTTMVGAMTVQAATGGAADHLDADIVKQDGRTDINDVYAFEASDPGRSVVAVTTNPGAGVISSAEYSPDAWYVINVDDSGDARADRQFFVSFKKPGKDGAQQVSIWGPDADGKMRFLGRGDTGEPVALKGGGMLQAGTFDDPFFFDLAAFRNNLQFCPGGVGSNFFNGLNTNAIVLEVPDAQLGSGGVGIWATTHDKATFSPIDRMGRPAINTVFIDAANKDRFNQTEPAADPVVFRDQVVSVLQSLGNDAERAGALADVLLPDVLTFDLDDPAGFLNGRKLADDVIDAELSLITNGAVPGDCVANDSAFRATFPYLAPAN